MKPSHWIYDDYNPANLVMDGELQQLVDDYRDMLSKDSKPEIDPSKKLFLEWYGNYTD